MKIIRYFIKLIKRIIIGSQDDFNNRVTCILGAGAVVDIGGPLTDRITQEIVKKNCLIAEIADKLDNYYGKDNYNFEDIFHVIESLRSFTGKKSAVKSYKPAIGAFSTIESKYMNSAELIKAEHDIINILSKLILKYDNNIFSEDNKWYADFWNEFISIYKLDIFTLNYDSTIQKSLGENITDGFEGVEGAEYKRLNPKKLISTRTSRVINLHGSIYFGYLRDKNQNRFALEDDFNELYRYDNFDKASQTWSGRSSNFAQSGDRVQISPIITGLRKTDKLLNFPLSIYNNILMNSVIKSPYLLISGYSFGDQHVNKIIEKMTSIHGESRRIVLITYLNDEAKQNWHPDPSVMDWLSNETFVFFAKSFNEYRPFEKGFVFKNPMISNDGKVRVYFDGFKKTIKDHKEEIINFFNS